MRQRITAALTRRRLGGAVLLLAGIIVAVVVLWPSGGEEKTAVEPLPIRIVSVPPLGMGFAHPRDWKRTISGETIRLASPDGSLVLIFSSPFDKPGADFAKHEALTTLLRRFKPAKIVHEGRSPLGRMGDVRSFELTGTRGEDVVRVLCYVTANQWRTYVVTMLTGENPSKRRLTEARRILSTVSFSKPRDI
jgi:hypothetical protein